MRILFDMGHPAHVHFFKNAIWALEKQGHAVCVTARDKDVTLKLLEAYKIPYENRGSAGPGTINKGLNMVKTDFKMLKIARKFKPDVMCGILNPYTAQVARLVGAKSITFTDTEHARRAKRITFPFTDRIMTPESYSLEHGKKHIRYKGYHELAYLHPNWFKPDPEVLGELGLSKDEKFSIVRFVSWGASHDVGFKGFSIEEKINMVKEIEKHAIPLITSEGKIPESLKRYQIRIPPHRIHHAINYASLYIGEGATMASEAAVLGVPSIYTNDLKVCYVDEQTKMGLTSQFSPVSSNSNEMIAEINKIFSQKKEHWLRKRDSLLKDKIDVTAFMVWFLENYPDSAKTMKKNSEFQNKFIYRN